MSLGGAFNYYYALLMSGTTSGDPLYLEARAGGTSSYARTTTGYSINTWHHSCAVVASATDRRVFIDGGSKDTETVTRNPTITTTAIGVNLHGGTAYNGMVGAMAEAAIWDVALTDAEVAIVASGISPLLMRPNDLVAYWPIIGRTSPEIDIFGGYDMSITGGSMAAAPHPRIAYPSHKTYQIPPYIVNPIVNVNTLVLNGVVISTDVIGGTRTVSLDTLTLAGSAVTANVNAVGFIIVDTLTLAGSAVTVSVDANVSIPVNTLTLSGSAVTVSAGTTVTTSVNTLTLASSAITASVVATVSISMNTLTLAGSAQVLYS